MATENIDSLGSFGIEDTLEMGMGNQELLQGLYETESASANPSDIEPIIKETEPASPPATPATPRGKDITPPKSVDGKTDEEKLEGQSLIADYLSSSEEDEDDEDPVDIKPKSTVTPKSENTEDNLDEPNSTQFSALANDLFKLGVFSKSEEEENENIQISTAEDFLERFNSEKKKGATEMVQNFIGQFGEDYQDAFDAIFVKGVNPKEYFGTYNQVVDFADMDLSVESNQEKVIKQALSDQGFDPEDIETEVERLRNYGDLETVATKHHKVLVKKEAAKLHQMEEKAEQELKQKQMIRNQYINNVQTILQEKVKNKEFDGIPVNPKLATELQDFLLVDKWKTPSGETLTDFDRTILDLKKPENHALKVKFGLLLKLLEKDPTLSTIQRSGITKKSDKLFTEVARQVEKEKNLNSGANPSSWFR